MIQQTTLGNGNQRISQFSLCLLNYEDHNTYRKMKHSLEKKKMMNFFPHKNNFYNA